MLILSILLLSSRLLVNISSIFLFVLLLKRTFSSIYPFFYFPLCSSFEKDFFLLILSLSFFLCRGCFFSVSFCDFPDFLSPLLLRSRYDFSNSLPLHSLFHSFFSSFHWFFHFFPFTHNFSFVSVSFLSILVIFVISHFSSFIFS